MPLAQAEEQLNSGMGNKENRRGYNVYTATQLMGITGKDKEGHLISGKFEQPIFYLSVEERLSIFRLCAPVHAVVSSRMNAISSLKFKVICEKEREDEIAEELKNLYTVYNEFSKVPELKYIVASIQIREQIISRIPEVLPDLSNFQSSLTRYVKTIKKRNVDEADNVEQWLKYPNQEDKFGDFIKKMVFDYLIHGACGIYKEKLRDVVENIYVLPGGTVVPLKDKYAGGVSAYLQIMAGEQPQIYYDDEITYANYLPTSERSFGLIPLEALINKVTESMLFDKLMADQADGTKLPEKMVIITDSSPFGDIDKAEAMPIDIDEQARIEAKINQPKKGAMMTFSGNGVTVVDLSRENTMSFQHERQKDIRSEVAMVFNATNMEMNLTGSGDTSGRSTSEVQMEIMQARGTKPIIDCILQQFNNDIIPFRFGHGFKLVCEAEKTEEERLKNLQLKMQTGLYSVNEIRKAENEDPFDSETGEFDKPAGAGQPQAPDGSEMNPLNMKSL